MNHVLLSVSQSPEPEVNGDTMVCLNHENFYETADNTGSTYSWEVEGGNIASGDGTHEISVIWTSTGAATVLVSETSADSCVGISDTLDIAVDDCTGIGEQPNEGINLYPNPVKDHIIIAFTSNKAVNCNVYIYNQLGKQLHKVQFNHKGGQVLHKINVASFPTGLYVVEVVTGQRKIREKIIVQ